MDAYMIIEAEIDDRQRFGEYAAAVMPLVDRYGGSYIVLGGRHLSLEGEHGNTRYVISRWPDVETAEAFWNSAEYAEIRKLREGTGNFRVIVLESLPVADPGKDTGK